MVSIGYIILQINNSEEYTVVTTKFLNIKACNGDLVPKGHAFVMCVHFTSE